ncbi:MAG TPA: hypothetical protein P5179_05490, partial [Candidatus Latescibacteria bacterium]|nr:hypothetical protein [Candidatus Latescibacterota bacterium]
NLAGRHASFREVAIALDRIRAAHMPTDGASLRVFAAGIRHRPARDEICSTRIDIIGVIGLSTVDNVAHEKI